MADESTQGAGLVAPRGAPPLFMRWSAPFWSVGLAAAFSTYLLIVLGGVVRVTGSGLGCPDWPLCHGQVVPPPDPPAAIEYSHRLMAGLTAGLVALTAVLALRQAPDPLARLVAALSPGIVVLQIALGAVAVIWELPPAVVLAHLALALLLLGLLVFLVVYTAPAPGTRDPNAARGASRRFQNLAMGAVAAMYLLALTGAYVQVAGASWACTGVPLCNGELWPAGAGPVVHIHLLHRLAVAAVGAHLLVTLVRAWRAERQAQDILAWSAIAGISFLLQGAIGAVAVSTGVQPLTQGLHVAGGAAAWAATVGLLAAAIRSRRQRAAPAVHQLP